MQASSKHSVGARLAPRQSDNCCRQGALTRGALRLMQFTNIGNFITGSNIYKNMKITLSLLGLLTIVFVVLKLVDRIDWSWWLVLSPIWVEILLLLVGIAFIAIVESNENKK